MYWIARLKRSEITRRLNLAIQYIDECGFPSQSRIWKKSDLFTALVEIDFALCDNAALSPTETLFRIEKFFKSVDSIGVETQDLVLNIYAKASIQASNDRLNRIRRGVIFSSVLAGRDPMVALVEKGLIQSGAVGEP